MRRAKTVATAAATTALLAGTTLAAPDAAAAQPRIGVLPPTGPVLGATAHTKRKRTRRIRRAAIPAIGARHRHTHGYGFARWAGDINVPGTRDYGNPVRARWAGRVVTVRYLTYSYGRHVKIAHPNGRTTLYAHLSRIVVRPGQRVRYGQLIGRVGSTGNSTGPHLHFEVR